jgi:NTE family protein
MTPFHVPDPTFQRANSDQRGLRGIQPGGDGAGIVLTLGGGFSRGFAHLGVLQVLEQERIPVSGIVGTSIGALLGAAYADGIPVSALCDLGRRVRVRDFLRFYPSEHGQGERGKDSIGQFIEKWFRAKSLEELPILTAIVATDLDSGAPFVFSRGPLEVAIRASCAFPGLVKPILHEGRLLGDGCIVAPVPTAIGAGLNCGFVLGVCVNPNSASSSASTSSENMVRVMDDKYRASHRSALDPSWCRHADILLEPQVQHIDWSDFSRVDDALSAGVIAMRQALPFVRELLSRQSRLGPAAGMKFPAERGLAL